MSTKQKVRARGHLARTCDECAHKTICILYHGHGQIELRFGNSYAKDPVQFVTKLDERLAAKCRFYLAAETGTGEEGSEEESAGEEGAGEEGAGQP